MYEFDFSAKFRINLGLRDDCSIVKTDVSSTCDNLSYNVVKIFSRLLQYCRNFSLRITARLYHSVFQQCQILRNFRLVI